MVSRLVRHPNWCVFFTIDAGSAFWQRLPEEDSVAARPPLEFREPGILWSRRALQGLRKSHQYWQDHQTRVFQRHGFERDAGDCCVYMRVCLRELWMGNHGDDTFMIVEHQDLLDAAAMLIAESCGWVDTSEATIAT